MIEKQITYRSAQFPPEIVKQAYGRFLNNLDQNDDEYHTLVVSREGEEWSFNSIAQFYQEYRKPCSVASLVYKHRSRYPSYSHQQVIPSCRVEHALLAEIEHYIQIKINLATALLPAPTTWGIILM